MADNEKSGLGGAIRDKGKAILAVLAGGAVIGYAGYRAHEEIKKAAAAREFSDEWHSSQRGNPMVVAGLDVFGEGNGASLAGHLLDDGYGIVRIEDRAVMLDMLPSMYNVKAIIVPATSEGRAAKRSMMEGQGGNIPVIEVKIGTLDEARLRRLMAEIKSRTQRADDESYRLLRKVMGYAETSMGTNGLKRAPGEIEDAIASLFRREQVLELHARDAHRSGVKAVLPSGMPIEKGCHYSAEGVCFKQEKKQDLEKILEDTRLFEASGSAAALAKPYFYAEMGGEDIIVARQYFIGPTLAEAVSLLRASGRSDRQGAVDSIVGSVIDIAAQYHRSKRAAGSPSEAKESAKGGKSGTGQGGSAGEVLEYYRSSLRGGFVREEMLLGRAGVVPADIELACGLLDEESLGTEGWYVRAIDMLLPNFKLRMGIEDPSVDELVGFLYGGRGDMPTAELEKKIGVYDQGYKDRHYFDTLARCIFSAYLGGARESRWTAYLKDALAREFVSRHSILGLVDYEKTRLPGGIAENFFIIACYKLARMYDDAVTGAKENEDAFALGRIGRETHDETLGIYVSNAKTYADSLALVAGCGARYFDTPIRHRSFKGIISGIEEAWHTQGGVRTPRKGSIGEGLMAFERIGRALANGADAIWEEIAEYRDRRPCRVEFR